MPSASIMYFCISFENSGDTLPFESINTQILEYYVERLNYLGINRFKIYNPTLKFIKSTIDNLDFIIQKLNSIPIKHIINTDIETRDHLDYLDQSYLNKLHADWVNFQKQQYAISNQRIIHDYSEIVEQIHDIYPDELLTVSVGDILQKLKIDDEFNKINVQVHSLESMFTKVCAKADIDNWIEIHNPYPKSCLSNNISNLSIDFNHLGRTLYNKFQNFDHEFKYDDENSYDELLGYVAIKIRPPETILMSSEYVESCRHFNREPIGNFLNIGNLVNLNDNLTQYRQLVYKNIQASNRFSIILNKD
jgi:hypothetical protein